MVFCGCFFLHLSLALSLWLCLSLLLNEILIAISYHDYAYLSTGAWISYLLLLWIKLHPCIFWFVFKCNSKNRATATPYSQRFVCCRTAFSCNLLDSIPLKNVLIMHFIRIVKEKTHIINNPTVLWFPVSLNCSILCFASVVRLHQIQLYFVWWKTRLPLASPAISCFRPENLAKF